MSMKIDPSAVLAVVSEQAMRIAQLEQEVDSLTKQRDNFKNALEQIGREREEAAMQADPGFADFGD